MTTSMKTLLAAALLSTVAGCGCETKTAPRFSKFEIPMPDGTTERTALDFGQVQVNVTSVRKFTVRNGGNLALSVDTATTAAPFGVKSTLPLTVEVSASGELEITFTPTEADQQITGKLTLNSNDPARPKAEIVLSGRGVTAVARLVPDPIAFGDVYMGETSKPVTVTLSNAGSDDLVVQSVAFSAATAGTVTGDLTRLKLSLGAGTTAQTDLFYAPVFNPGSPETLSGAALVVTLDPMQGGTLTIPITGRSTVGLPKMCFVRDGFSIETCADISGTSVQLPVGNFCDTLLNPGCADGGFTGKITFRNEGNIQVAYSLQWNALPYSTARCDGGSTGSDFTFGNAPVLADGGRQSTFNEATVKLPPNPTDLKPWNSASVSVSYRATSRCRDDAADQARVLWTRQGEPAGTSRMPGSLFLTLSAGSQLPRAVTSDWSCGTSSSPATVPCSAPFFGTNNAGDAPLSVTNIELWEEFLVTDAGPGPNGGFFQSCSASGPGSPCDAFAWAATDGGNPNTYAPHSLPPTTNPSIPTQKQLGTLTFGPAGRGCVDAGTACPNTPYRVYAVITTDDPYGPKVISKISGYGN